MCALSISTAMIVAGRAVQGAGGGGLITLVNLCISDLFSMRERPKYFGTRSSSVYPDRDAKLTLATGLVGVVWALSSSVGPVLGGVFTQRVRQSRPSCATAISLTSIE